MIAAKAAARGKITADISRERKQILAYTLGIVRNKRSSTLNFLAAGLQVRA